MNEEQNKIAAQALGQKPPAPIEKAAPIGDVLADKFFAGANVAAGMVKEIFQGLLPTIISIIFMALAVIAVIFVLKLIPINHSSEGRFQMATRGNSIVRMDTKTGQLWRLSEYDMGWIEIPGTIAVSDKTYFDVVKEWWDSHSSP